ncbi:MAG: MarR family transcriptional regulator [Corynebacterium sp.]|nr:MarR family transcriptional regulator [Corynebacterium sp.]
MKYSRYQNPETMSPGFVLWRVTTQWQREIVAALAPLQLTHAQFIVLACILRIEEEHNRPVNQIAIAKQANMVPQVVSQILRKIEPLELIQRPEDPNDARAKLVSLTKKGKKTTEQAIKLVEDTDAAFFHGISDDVITELSGLVERNS